MRLLLPQFKMWLHYSVVYNLVLPWVPEGYGARLYRASRALVYGPGYCELTELAELARRAGARDLH